MKQHTLRWAIQDRLGMNPFPWWRSLCSSLHARSLIPGLALLPLAVGLIAPAVGAQTSLPPCFTSQAPFLTHRWGGLIHDAFTLPDGRTWLVEDGGRIRYSATGDFLSSGTWSFQKTPLDASSQLLRVHASPGGGRVWAVGEDGLVLGSVNSGTTWSCLWSELDASQITGKAILFDIYFLADGIHGWLVGLHQLKYTNDGGLHWTDAQVTDSSGSALIDLTTVELYAMDFLQVGSGFVGLVTGEPGLVLRTSDQAQAGALWTASPTNVGTLADNLCASMMPPCSGTGFNYEPWDVEFVPGTNLAQAEALIVGGKGNHFGVIFATHDAGLTWLIEPHECTLPGATCNAPLYGPPDRWKYFETLYSVGTFSDGVAVASGYGAQQVVRVPPSSPTQAGVWQDRTNYGGGCVPVPNKLSTPLVGADTTGSSTAGTAFLVGEFNAIRKSTDGGQTYLDQTDAYAGSNPNDLGIQAYRLQDVGFVSNTRGFQVSQFQRVAETTDGGKTFTVVYQNSNVCENELLHAIAWNGGTRMMAVGQVMPSGIPSILVGVIGASSSTWIPATNVPVTNAPLFDVDSAGGPNWLACGPSLLLRTSNGGSTWNSVNLIKITQSVGPFDIHGLAFDTPDRGFVAGCFNPASTNERGAIFFTTDATATVPHWTNVTGFGTATDIPVVFMDVASNGTDAIAVGMRRRTLTGGAVLETGLVLKWNGTTFALENYGPELPYCMLDGEFFDTPIHTRGFADGDVHVGSILNEVEFVPGSSNAWVGGDCGRLLFYENGVWRQDVKSETSLHIIGMSLPSASAGYFAGRARGIAGITGFSPSPP